MSNVLLVNDNFYVCKKCNQQFKKKNQLIKHERKQVSCVPSNILELLKDLIHYKEKYFELTENMTFRNEKSINDIIAEIEKKEYWKEFNDDNKTNTNDDNRDEIVYKKFRYLARILKEYSGSYVLFDNCSVNLLYMGSGIYKIVSENILFDILLQPLYFAIFQEDPFILLDCDERTRLICIFNEMEIVKNKDIDFEINI